MKFKILVQLWRLEYGAVGPTRYCHIMNERMDEIGLTLPKRIMMQSI